jgi:hypothetical protein
MKRYARPALAQHFLAELIGKTFLSDARNGLFLAAPRRTGKTDFLKNDLMPALKAAGLLPMYVDLWSDRSRPRSELIAEVIGDAMDESLGFVAKAAKNMGVKTLKLTGNTGVFSSTLEIDTSKIGKNNGFTIPRALQLLHEASKKILVLIIDEAQDALTTSDGENAMRALKSARDQMRDAQQSNLLLVMSGSHQDKLSRLLNSHATPFWGSAITAMPTLGKPYALDLAALVIKEKPVLLSIDKEEVWNAFQASYERPQLFEKLLLSVINDSVDAPAFTKLLIERSKEWQAKDRDSYDVQFKELSKEQRVVLWRLLEQGADFRPFDAAALKFYASHLDKKITVLQTQRVLDKMRDLDSPLIWKSARGEYSLYDSALANWYSYRQSEQKWASLMA